MKKVNEMDKWPINCWNILTIEIKKQKIASWHVSCQVDGD